MLLLGIAGCASLPSSGPTAHQIVKDERAAASDIGFSIVELTSQTVPTPVTLPSMSPLAMEKLARDARVDLVGPGDVLGIMIYEVGVTLFSSGQTTISGADLSAPTAKAQSVGGVTVRENGTIQLPYIGVLAVAGHTTGEIERMIESRLRGLSQRPQAQVAVSQNVRNSILVSGAVVRPGRQPLTLARERLLDVIAAAGGTGEKDGPANAIVRLYRDGNVAEVYLSEIASGSASDLILIPGDRIDVIHRPRSFSVFGAAGKVSQVTFTTNQLSLAEAVAQAGGPDDSRADPSAVFVFRDGAEAGSASAPPKSAPVVYRLNLQKPSSYFIAQRFAMRDKDVIFVANARLNTTRKLVEIFNVLFTPVFTIRQTVQ